MDPRSLLQRECERHRHSERHHHRSPGATVDEACDERGEEQQPQPPRRQQLVACEGPLALEKLAEGELGLLGCGGDIIASSKGDPLAELGDVGCIQQPAGGQQASQQHPRCDCSHGR